MSAHRVFAASAGFAALLSLSACSALPGGGGDGPLAGVFGGPSAPAEDEATSFEEFVGADYVSCPRPEVIQGQAAMRAYRGGRTGSSQDLRYQISIVDIARECVATPDGQNRIKIGVRGRALIGPAGAPGTFAAPVRIVVRTPSTVYDQRSRRVSVAVPQGRTLADFTVVEEGLEIPLSVGDNFLIEVGIDG